MPAVRQWLAGVTAALATSAACAQMPVEVSFLYPLAVGGPIARIIDGYASDFEKENAGIRIKPIYLGTYQESIAKALDAVKSGGPPVMSVLLSSDMYTLIDEDAIIPFDDLVKTAEDRAWLKSFYSGFMENSQTGGKTWGIPFQRSTLVLYYNKEAFKEAGLDPNKPPGTWAEMVDYAQKLTKRDASGKVARWGIQIPSSGFPYWLFQALAIENGVNLMNATGTETYYDKPEAIEALQYWVDLAGKHKVHPEGIVDWGTTPLDFFERKAAMIWTTTGNLTSLRNNAKFDYGVAMLPANKQRGAPTGGGNFYVFRKSTVAQRDAAFKFIRWVTTPQRAAQWSVDTGYVAVRPDAWEMPAMKRHVAGFPAVAVARDQLPFAKAELSTHDNQRVTKALNDGLQAALTGPKTP
jgi:sn-glycerol 3-phosphate transport system substrate-binding protein